MTDSMKNKVFFPLVILLAGLPCFAREVTMEPRETSFDEAARNGMLKDKESLSHSAKIDGETYPAVWSYWALASGDAPENFVLEQLCWHVKQKDDPTKGSFRPDSCGDNHRKPYVQRANFMMFTSSLEKGLGMSFANPFRKKTRVIVEGRLRFYNATIFVFKKNRTNSVVPITSTQNPGAIARPPGRGGGDHYLKLQFETVLEPYEQVFFIAVDDKKTIRAANKPFPIFTTNDRWGKIFQPIIIFDLSNEN